MKHLAALACLTWAAPALAQQGPHDILLILDTTGSTGSVLPTWRTNMKPNMAAGLEAAFPGSRFAIIKHEDFPFAPHGAASDVPYQLIVPLTPFANWDASVQPALDAMTAGSGSDGPEAQYVALTLALKGAGLDQNGDGDYSDLGDIAPGPVGLDLDGDGDFSDPGDVDPADNALGFDPANKCIVMHFTTPDSCHDSDTDLSYPQAGIPNLNTPSKTEAEALYVTNPHVTLYHLEQGPLDFGGVQPPASPVTDGVKQLALASGGLSLGVGANLEDLKAAMVKIMSNEGACPAFVSTRTGPGNSNNYAAAPLRLGQNWTGQILTIGQPANLSWIALGTTPLSLPLPGLGTLLIGGSSYAGSDLLGPKSGPFALFSAMVPNNPALCGATLYTQGGVLQLSTSTITLTNAQDLLVGTVAIL